MFKKKDEEEVELSKAERIRGLIQKHKKLIRKHQSLVEFQEPVLFLERRNGDWEIYEHATKGEFWFTHSDGSERKIFLEPARQNRLDYAGRKIRVYKAHEDYPFPGVDDPIVSGERVQTVIENSLEAINKYKSAEERAKGIKVKNILIGLAILIGAIALAILIIPQAWWDKILGGGKETVVQENTNATTVIPVLNVIGLIITQKCKQMFNNIRGVY